MSDFKSEFKKISEEHIANVAVDDPKIPLLEAALEAVKDNPAEGLIRAEIERLKANPSKSHRQKVLAGIREIVAESLIEMGARTRTTSTKASDSEQAPEVPTLQLFPVSEKDQGKTQELPHGFDEAE